jgi:hypothetical protein
LLFKAVVRPHLEYASSIWCPHQKADILSVENVQKRATKMLPSLKNMNCEERLRELKLPTLRFRRLSGDMIEVYKILTGRYDKKVADDIFEVCSNKITRGHSMKLNKKRCRIDIRKYYFTNRVVDIWKDLPESVVSANTMFTFENKLDKYSVNQPMKYDFNSDYITGRDKSIVYEEEEQNTLATSQPSESP